MLTALLAAFLVAPGWSAQKAATPAHAPVVMAAPATRRTPVIGVVPGLTLPPSVVVPGTVNQTVSAAPQAAVVAASAELQGQQEQAAAGENGGEKAASAWTGGAKFFDGLGLRSTAFSIGMLPAAAHASTALVPALNSVGYGAANVLSVAFPLPEMHKAYKNGHAENFPIGRAMLGAVGTVALGMVNAPVLDKPFWGMMHVFVGLGMMAPFFIGLWLKRRAAKAQDYQPPLWLAPPTMLQKLKDRFSRDGALRATALTAGTLLIASWAIYGFAAGFVPAYLAAHFTVAVTADILLSIQIAKGLMFVGMFAPDAVALLRGKPAHGFSMAFTTIFLASVASFAIWGFTSALLSDPGPIREQYVVLGLRNLAEAAAAALSLWALHRAKKNAAH